MPRSGTDLAERLEELLPDRLVSDARFRGLVGSLLEAATARGCSFRIVVTGTKSGGLLATYASERKPDAAPTYVRSLPRPTRAAQCRCEFWSDGSDGSDLNGLADAVATLVDRHWGERDPATMLPYLKSAETPARFAATARAYATTSSPMAVLHTDLDRFKQINSELGEPAGNAVLAEFAERLRLAFQEMGVPVRTGGDEFSAILDFDDPSATIATVERFRRSMETEPLVRIRRVNTCSIGLALYPDAGRFAAAVGEDPILEDARSAEMRAKEEGRNRICLVGPAPEQLAPSMVSSSDLVQTALASRRLGTRRDAGDRPAMLDVVRDLVRGRIADGMPLPGALEATRGSLGLLVGRFAPPDDRPEALLGVVSSLAWAEIAASAVLEACFDGQRPLPPDLTLELLADEGGDLSLRTGEGVVPLDCRVAVEEPVTAVVGRPFFRAGSAGAGAIARLPVAAPADGGDPLSPVLLLPIGDDAKEIADSVRHLAAAVVDVDDRPARGGGLPDFWQSNLSRVIRAVLANPNIEDVIAIGDASFAQLTMERLRADGSLPADRLQARLSIDAADVATFRRRRLRVMEAPADRATVLRAMEAVVASMIPTTFEDRPAVDRLSRSRRRLRIPRADRSRQLDVTDGLRTRALADAYPEALQLIRGASDGLDHEEPKRGSFREATGFKVVLTEPFVDKVPDYWSDDADRLESYYQEGFRSPQGLFGRRLAAGWDGDGRSPWDFAVEETASATLKRSPTRRINVPVVPDRLEHPLGLSTIQIMPRERNGLPTVDAMFVWRTVDALVGFPFSAYGSIRWAEDLIAAVSRSLGGQNGVGRIRGGTVTYMALSFHMYLHEGDTEIARTIVQDASI